MVCSRSPRAANCTLCVRLRGALPNTRQQYVPAAAPAPGATAAAAAAMIATATAKSVAEGVGYAGRLQSANLNMFFTAVCRPFKLSPRGLTSSTETGGRCLQKVFKLQTKTCFW